MKELWKPIILKGVQERYAISCLGKYMNIHDNGAGYKNVKLRKKDKGGSMHYIHRLIAYAFIDNPNNHPQVGHKDHTRSNNVVENLYWTTQKQNTADGIKAGRINAKLRGPCNHLTKEDIRNIAVLENKGCGVNEIAVELGFPRTTISSVFNGRSNWKLFNSIRNEFSNKNF